MAGAKKDDKELKTIEDTLNLIEKTYGKGSIMRLGDRPHVEVDVIPTGSLLLDHALGVGGYPRGRMIEIFGPESSGKTTLALHAIAEVQKQNGKAAFIDVEHSIDPVYAENLGVDIDELVLAQPDYGEEALEITEILAKSGQIDLIVIDSVAALVPHIEFEGIMSDQSVGAHARLMSKALRKLVSILNKSNCCIIFINQLREKVGVMYGNPETTTGGRALKFYASVRLDIRRNDAIKDGTEIVGNKVTVKVVKNKVAPPFKSVQLEIIYGKGIGRMNEIIDLATQMGIFKRMGSWYEFDGKKIGQGKETVRQYLEEHEEVLSDVTTRVRSYIESPDGVVKEN